MANIFVQYKVNHLIVILLYIHIQYCTIHIIFVSLITLLCMHGNDPLDDDEVLNKMKILGLLTFCILLPFGPCGFL